MPMALSIASATMFPFPAMWWLPMRSLPLPHVRFSNPTDIPRNITFKLGRNIDNEGRSWTFLVYLLDNNFADIMLGDKDPLPLDNDNPQHFVGPILPGEAECVQYWVEEKQWEVPHNFISPQLIDGQPDNDENASQGWGPWEVAAAN
ncbi:hypothetical protein GUJ93_ZPchr0015g6985 [Zizania palustris]|uniref:Uncharacterized protein n=1 Tax=Zizania palustris TaxID=103762 RepID=A0A8J5SYE0_ZIZPA|nr:hypothetical protein GUJ93_ZPchr0015g6985 [Zizania palustris]